MFGLTALSRRLAACEGMQTAILETLDDTTMGKNLSETNKRIAALEEYIGITFCEGPSTKAHYKKRRPKVANPVGRPKKK